VEETVAKVRHTFATVMVDVVKVRDTVTKVRNTVAKGNEMNQVYSFISLGFSCLFGYWIIKTVIESLYSMAVFLPVISAHFYFARTDII